MSESIDQYLQQPVIVVGAPRSGTTFLGTLLSQHPALAFVGEPRLTWRYGNDGKSDMLRAADARPNVRQHIRSVFGGAVRDAGRQRLLEKHPSNSLRMEFVDAVLPGCLFIHIIRDGVESVISMQQYWNQHSSGVNPQKLLQRLREAKLRQLPYYAGELARRLLPSGKFKGHLWGPRIPGLETLVKELDVVDITCMQWRMCVEAACHYGRQLPSDRYFECRLEDMSPDLIRQVLDFAKLDDSPEVWAEFEKKFDSDSTTYRRSGADEELVQRISRTLEPTMQWLGYGASSGRS